MHHLFFTGNPFEDACVKVFEDALMKNTSLTHLELSGSSQNQCSDYSQIGDTVLCTENIDHSGEYVMAEALRAGASVAHVALGGLQNKHCNVAVAI